MRPDGSDRRQITDIPAAESIAPEFSPDGRRIVFHVAYDDGSGCAIALVDPDGTNLTILPHDPGVCDNLPSFMPNGREIVFGHAVPDKDEAIWRMSVDGTHRAEIGVGPGMAYGPTVSPDGTKVSAVGWNLLEGDAQHEGVFVMSIDGSNPQFVTPHWTVFSRLDWSPDGQWLLITENTEEETRSSNIVAVHPDGTDLHFLTNYGRADQRAAVGSYSPDGQWIMFRLREHDLFGLYLMRPDGSDVRMILEPSTFGPLLQMDWGPDPADASR